MLGMFYKKHEDDKVWWVDEIGTKGKFLFSFDKKRIFNLYRDYPFELTKEEKDIFDKENPFWAEQLGNRKRG